MKGVWKCALGLLALALLTATSRPASAQLYSDKEIETKTVTMPKPSEVKSLTAEPASVTLKGQDDSAQLVITGQLANRQQDVTGHVEYVVGNPSLVKVTPAGRVIPLQNGETTITAKYGDKRVSIGVKTGFCDVNLPINFTNDIVPIFTKLGCNSGGCHGKSGGQNGFALSLLGFVPDIDYNALVKEARGRRVFPSSPDHSLLLMKATGRMAHGGGGRMKADSDEYKLVRRWIASGMPKGKDTDPKIVKITVSPEHRILTRNNRQQFAVYAHYSDGSIQDVTQRAQYESNDQEIAVVDGAGLVRSLGLSGEAAIMARYQAQVAVFRATVPLGMKVPEYAWESQTVVDTHTQAKWKELGIVPSGLCTDREFIRRVYLDLTGTLPTPDQVGAFLKKTAPEAKMSPVEARKHNKKQRDQLIEGLLETPEYAYYFANKWADILRVKRGRQVERATGTYRFHKWIKDAVANDMPYNRFVRAILAANGDETTAPPTVWYRELSKPEEFVDDTAQVFLGLRIACAQCHHHPYEKWSQDDYWGMAAFFGRIGRKNRLVVGGVSNRRAQELVIYTRTSGSVRNTRTNSPAPYVPLDSGKTLDIGPEHDPRHKLVDWMVEEKNPYFAKAVANRYWSHFFGRGIVDPIDDMRVTNPPSNPQLLDALTQEVVNSKFSLKHLIKVICQSRTYQLSSNPNEYNKHDKQAYARFYPRRMSAEVLYDAVNQVTGTPHAFNGIPNDKHAPRRAIMLFDESFSSYFLDVFGRPQRISACECERVSEANLAQALHLLNSNEVQGKLSRGGGLVDQLVRDKKKSHGDKVVVLFQWCFSRSPSDSDLSAALRHIAKNESNVKLAYEDILWALINTKEFVFNR